MKMPALVSWREALIRQAASYRYIREYAGANKGEGVEWCQRSTGNAPPDYWCMSFVTRVGLSQFGPRWPLLVTASCEQQRAFAEKRGALRTRSQFTAAIHVDPVSVLGWVWLEVKMIESGTLTIPHAHHTGFVGAVVDVGTPKEAIAVAGPNGIGFYTNEGNAADPAKPGSRDGNGAYNGRVRGKGSDELLYAFIDLEAF